MLPPAEEKLTLTGIPRPAAVTLLRDGARLHYSFSEETLTVEVPASMRTTLVDVVQVDLTPGSVR